MRSAYYDKLFECLERYRAHGPSIIIGDLNARLHVCKAGEDKTLGPYTFGNPNANWHPNSNRNLLLDRCQASEYVVANTFFERPVEQRVTYFELSARPTDDIEYHKFAELDHVLIHRNWLTNITAIRSHRGEAFQSHHFLVTVDLSISIEKQHFKRHSQVDLTELRKQSVAENFTMHFNEAISARVSPNQLRGQELEAATQTIATCMSQAGARSIPSKRYAPHRPWITSKTLDLIALRDNARKDSQPALEIALHKTIRLSAKSDRKQWLEEMLSTGCWQAIKK